MGCSYLGYEVYEATCGRYRDAVRQMPDDAKKGRLLLHISPVQYECHGISGLLDRSCVHKCKVVMPSSVPL